MDFGLALWAAASTDASTWSTVGKITLNIIWVILGINALIIVHEFGHFAVARLCGVRCEKFYIWFDFWGLKFFKFKWGDTEYGLGVFPLGGYVKMLGQEDNPGELRAEMERAKALSSEQGAGDAAPAESPGDAAPEPPAHTLEELNEAIYAPDSYLAKSVPQRMAIIVAGVTMNFLFAIVCATGAYLYGFKDTAPAVGNLIPGSPAWEAGLEPGDRIVAINDKPARVFTDINMAMVGGEDGVKLTIDRPVAGQSEPRRLEKTLVPRKRKNDLAPSIGVTSLHSLEFASEKKPAYPWSEKYFSEEALETLKKPNLEVYEVDGQPIRSFVEFQNLQLAKIDQPITCKVSLSRSYLEAQRAKGINLKLAPPVDVQIPATPMKEIGVRFKTGPITMVLPGSDAEKKGIKPGDVIVSVDGDSEFDPLKLPQIILRKVNEEQKSVELTLRESGGEEKTLTVELAPIRNVPGVGPLSMKDPVGSTALGLSWGVEPIIAGIMKTTDVSEQKKTPPIGGKVVSVKFVHAVSMLTGNSFTKEEKDGYLFFDIGDKIDLPYIFDVLLQAADSKTPTDKEKAKGATKKTVSVRLEIAGEDGKAKRYDFPILESDDWFNLDRGLILKPETATVKIDDFGEALSAGTEKMLEYSMSVFTFLKRLFSGGISPKALGGPVMIVQAAYMFVEKGFGAYLLFLCLIGANLAVINILPIPVLDGGHLVFLAYEGVFRKPPNETVQVVLSYIGLFLILSLMVWVVSLDVGCISRF